MKYMLYLQPGTTIITTIIMGAAFSSEGAECVLNVVFFAEHLLLEHLNQQVNVLLGRSFSRFLPTVPLDICK